MSKRYASGVVSSTSPTVNAAGASGVFTLNQQSAAQSTNNWPPYKVEKSLRFRASNSAYLSRTPAVAGNQKTWTWSGWVKRSDVSTNDTRLFGAGSSNSNRTLIAIENYISVVGTNSGSNVLVLQTSAFYRDPSAWYHIVVACDTTQSTSSNRAKIYVNGVQVTAFGTATYPSQNTDLRINSTDAHVHGTRGTYSVDSNFDGYMAEVNFIDGQALTPSSFGGTDKDGNWSPIAYTGTYGNNGFYLNFKDATSTSTVGYDYSGNGNNWASSGISVTAGATYDSMIDVPVDQSDGTANNRGSYCTLNPIDAYDNAPTQGNLARIGVGHTGSPWSTCRGTMGVTSGKWYFEATLTGSSGSYQSNSMVGVMTAATSALNDAYGGSTSRSYQANGGLQGDNSTGSASSAVSGDVIMCAFDIDAGKVWFGKNGTWFNSGVPASGTGNVFTSVPASPVVPAVHMYGNTGDNNGWYLNFGQQSFIYAPPSGFKTLNTFNLPEPTIKQPNKYFDAVIWTGDQTNKQIPLNFTADFVWAKRRNNSDNHVLYDAIRGVNNGLNSNNTNQEATNNYGLDFDNGNYLAIDGTQYFGGGGGSGITFVAWNWNAGGSTVTNTAGSISAQVRANPTAGFSIVTYTGNGGTSATVGHGLGVAPSMIIIKVRSNAIRNWVVYHASLGSTRKIHLNLTDADEIENGSFGGLSPTSTTFGVGYAATNGSSETFVAYCFAQVAGYSAFGKYTGNGDPNGPFVYLGFRPRFIMIKRSNAADSWIIHDTARDIYNGYSVQLYPNSSSAEGGPYSPPIIDELSNGFKCRSSASGTNGSGDTFIYMAFAENPFKYARSR